MKSFRDGVSVRQTASVIETLRATASRRDLAGLLVETGVLEQGLTDALCPVCDDDSPFLGRLRALTRAAASAWLSSIAGRPASIASYLPVLDALAREPLPAKICLRGPEGYLHYALDPAGYAASARSYLRDCGQGARNAIVVGVRSIGTSLAAVVSTVIGTSDSVTVRPRGEPGSRTVSAGPALTALLKHARGDVLVVDEGPGATGETFACVTSWLKDLGIHESRIVLFPSHTGGMGMAPESRRSWFGGMRKVAPPVEHGRLGLIAQRLGTEPLHDLSEARWREVLPGTSDFVACPNHERRKLLARGKNGACVQIRYAGLGLWGDAVAHRASVLGDTGTAPAFVGFTDGFMAVQWAEPAPVDSTSILDAVAHYVVGRAPLFKTGLPVQLEPFLDMLAENATEALGTDVPLSRAIDRLTALPEREAIVPDARLQRREWVSTRNGFQKIDAWDHGDGPRLPGPADAAWDLAAATIEFSLTHEFLDAVVARVAAASRDVETELRAAVEAWKPVYAAAALGEADLSAREALDSTDEARLHHEAARYREALRGMLIH